MAEQIVDDGEELAEGVVPQYEEPEEGFETVSQDVEGYYDPIKTGAIYFKPHSIRLIDNSQDSTKSSALLFGELTRPALLKKNAQKKEEQTMEQFEAGASVGIWVKAGMRDLLNLGGAEVWMVLSGYRKLEGRDKPMAVFKCKRLASGPKGERLALASDSREESLAEPAIVKNPPWWLEVLPDGGMEVASEILAERAAAAGNKGRRGGTKNSTAAAPTAGN